MEAITREEKLLSGQQLEPITRKELFLAKAAGMDVQTPEPITREEIFLSQISGGGSSPVVEPLSVTENGTYTAPSGVDGYSPVTVNVASSGGDEWEQQFIAAIVGEASNPVTKLPDGLTSIGRCAFYGNNALRITSLPVGVTSIGAMAFYSCRNLAITSLPFGLTDIGAQAFYQCVNLEEITFQGKPETIAANAFYTCAYLKTINVPWAEGEVANAPWGAPNATINYNYTGG